MFRGSEKETMNQSFIPFPQKNQLRGAAATLANSPLFGMSLGSKELFHSNFLWWLSTVDWDKFVAVMRQLSHVNQFWWENLYHPQNGNLKVLREYRKFDLSIYINKGQKKKKGGGMTDIWVPVLILENKVKSLPRQEQLDEYLGKAFDDWKVDKVKNTIVHYWGGEPISFILLTLVGWNQTYGSTYSTKIAGVNSTIIQNWESNSYQDLYNALNVFTSTGNNNAGNCYFKSLIDDYRSFIHAIHDMANNQWVLNGSENYINKIYPWANAIYKGDDVAQLRLDDVRQKIYYEQLLYLLAQKMLQNKGIQLNVVNRTNISKAGAGYVNAYTWFSHNTGVMHAYVQYQNFQIGVELQGNNYEHFFRTQKKNKSTKTAAKHLDQLRSKTDFFFEFGQLPRLGVSKFPWGRFATNKPNSKIAPLYRFGFYNPDFLYQKVEISPTATIGEVLDYIVNDIGLIIQNLP